MGWTSPAYSKGEIARAGRTLINADATQAERGLAIAVANNWRSAHSFPLNTLQINLRKRAQLVDADALVAQRIKRLPSILGKLSRFPAMNLARMQDLGGCRAVVADVDRVDDLLASLLESKHKHRLVRQDDYIDAPKPSGYRGVHIVYAYRSDKITTWNDLRIEVQIRSRLQHAWATAVETVGLFTDQALKSSIGDFDWLRFFAVMSSIIGINEGRPTVPGTSSDLDELKTELRQLSTQLDVVNKLQGYAALLQLSEEHMAGAKYVLLTLDVPENQLTIRGFRRPDDAAAAYGAVEGTVGDQVDVVMVAVSSIVGLRSAYPNYFLDTTRFVEILQSALR